MDRKHAKRELERAIGTIAWTVQHVSVVYNGFVDAAMNYAEQDMDVPDSYVEPMNALVLISESLIAIGEAIKEVNNLI